MEHFLFCVVKLKINTYLIIKNIIHHIPAKKHFCKNVFRKNLRHIFSKIIFLNIKYITCQLNWPFE